MKESQEMKVVEETKRDIPDSVMRQLRQESGFGCCRCGNPIIQYHHIIEFSEHNHHNPADMMALCPNDHELATAHVITEEQQRRWKNYPHNIQKGLVHGLLYIPDKTIAILAGSNLFVGHGFKLIVDEEPLLALDVTERGELLVSVDLYDENNNLLASIDKNMWIAGSTELWDVDYKKNSLTIRSKKYKIILEIDAKKKPIRIYGKLYKNGQLFTLTKNQLRVNNKEQWAALEGIGLVFGCMKVESNVTGFKLGTDQADKAFYIVNKGTLEENLKSGLELYNKYKNVRI